MVVRLIEVRTPGGSTAGSCGRRSLRDLIAAAGKTH